MMTLAQLFDHLFVALKYEETTELRGLVGRDAIQQAGPNAAADWLTGQLYLTMRPCGCLADLTLRDQARAWLNAAPKDIRISPVVTEDVLNLWRSMHQSYARSSTSTTEDAMANVYKFEYEDLKAFMYEGLETLRKAQ